MRAQQVVELTGPEGLRMAELPEPAGDSAVLIDVKAAGVSFPDLLLTRGMYQHRPEPPFVPGVEGAGVVRSAPPGSDLAPGDRVAVFSMGCFAEVVAAEPDTVFPIPDGLDFEQAAGFLMNYHTAHFALHRRGRLNAGETVLVRGGAGGTGTAAVQVAKGLGAHVIAGVGTERKAGVARDAGADETVVGDEGWLDRVRELTGGRGVDVVFDPVGGDGFDDCVRALAPEGRLLVIGFAGGQIPRVAVNRLLFRNIDVVGAGWGAFIEHEPAIVAETNAALAGLIGSGHVRPIVGASYPLEQAADALRELAERRAVGKIVLTI